MGSHPIDESDRFKTAADNLLQASKMRICWACNCLSGTLSTIEESIPRDSRSPELQNAIDSARARSLPPEVECRGCEICYPAVALNALADVAEPEALGEAKCSTRDVSARGGWPPMAGNFTVLGYQRPVAVCTLNSEELCADVAKSRPEEVAIVGTLKTENLGIERLIQNVTANPNIRFLVVCGDDSENTCGHLPGQSLVALGTNGVDEQSKIIRANGKRPVIRNIELRMVEHFRRSVEILDMIGEMSSEYITATTSALSANNPGPAEPFQAKQIMPVEGGHLPDRVVSDPKGFFVIYPDRVRHVISLEHFSNNGVLTAVIEGKTAAEVYYPAIEKKLLSRLDHACYLGRELAKAEHSLETGQKYVQDAAPERSSMTTSCACSTEVRRRADE